MKRRGHDIMARRKSVIRRLNKVAYCSETATIADMRRVGRLAEFFGLPEFLEHVCPVVWFVPRQQSDWTVVPADLRFAFSAVAITCPNCGEYHSIYQSCPTR